MPRLALWWPVLTTVAQPQDPSLVGWRMVDRFAGFRYEVKGPHVVQSGFHTAAEKLADELDDLMIAYLKACRETPDKAPGLEKKMKAKTAQLAALQDQGIDAHPSWADVE